MLSYRHGFHAGNHADVLKHLTQALVLEYLTRKDKPFCYIDTHSGAGDYSLEHSFAQKTAEWEEGIGRLGPIKDLPEAMKTYLDVVCECADSDKLEKLRYYPGSPSVAAALLRPYDRIRLFELHPADSRELARNFRDDRRVKVDNQDGFAGLKGLLPPIERRGLVLIDPPYEVKEDYRTVLKSLKCSLERFAQGIYAVWYPRIDSEDSRTFAHRVEKCGAERWLHVTLQVRGNHTGGMYASSMFVINPPWLLKEQLEQALPVIVEKLGQDPDARFTIRTHGLD